MKFANNTLQYITFFFTLHLLLLLPTITSAANNPGIVVAIREQTIDDVKNFLLPQVISQLQNLNLPNFNSNGFEISNIVITSLVIPTDQTSIQFNDKYISVSTSGLAIRVSLHIKYNLPFGMSISATTTASASNSDVSLNVEIDDSTQEFATVTVNNTNVDINNLNIQISGALGKIASSVINLLTPMLSNTINNALSSAIQSSAQQAINKALAKVPDTASIPGTPLGADYGLTANPVITTDYISISIDGTFYNDNKPFAYPPIPGPTLLPIIDQSVNENIQFFISEYVFNSAAYGLYDSNFISITITPNMIPKSWPISFTTSSLSLLLPQLQSTYGSNLPVQLVCSGSNAIPSIGILTTGVTANLTGNCIIQVQESNNIWANAVTLAFNINGLVNNITIQNYSLYGNVQSLSISNMTAINSSIGNVNTNNLQSILNTFSSLAIPLIDQNILSKGFPIPSIPDANLQSTEITLYNGYLKVGATPVFT